MSVADILEKAADLIEPEGAFAHGQYATTKEGRWAPILGKSAACFCTVGAIARVMNTGASQAETWIEENNVRKLLGARRTVAVWNDRRKQAEVVAKLREAAAKARKASQ